MKIKKAVLNAFGKFTEATFYFTPGINLIYGENEAGKSTLSEFIFNMLYGQKKYGVKKRIYSSSYYRNMPWQHHLYQGILQYSIGDVEYRVERNFHAEGEFARVFEEHTGQEITSSFSYDARKELQFLSEQTGLNERNFINTIYVGQNDMKGSLFDNQEHILEELVGKSIYGVEGENGEKTLRELIRGLEKKKKDIGTQKSKSKPLGQSYDSLRDQIKTRIELEKKLESYNSYQTTLLKIEDELKTLRENKKELIRVQEAWNNNKRKEKLMSIEQLYHEKNDLLKYIESHFPIDIRENTIETLHHQRKLNRVQTKKQLSFIAVMACIGILIAIWTMIAPYILLQSFLLLIILILFILGINQWINNNRKDDELFHRIEKAHQFQDAKFELDHLEERLKGLLDGQSIEVLKKEMMEFDNYNKRISQTINHEQLMWELKDLDEKELHLVKERTIYQTKIIENKWNPKELEKVEREIVVLEEEIREMEEYIQAIDIAISTLATIEKSDKIKWLPRIIKKSQENIYKITKKYHTIKIDDQYQLKTIEPVTGKMVNVEQLSQGTLNQFYLALRISLIQSLSSHFIYFPIILDEPFLYFDELRFHESMDLLEMLSRKHQIFIFSSQGRERDYLKHRKVDYNYIEL